MSYTIKIDAVALDDNGNVVPGHEFHLEIPGQTENALEEFEKDFAKFGEQERKKARHGK